MALGSLRGAGPCSSPCAVRSDCGYAEETGSRETSALLPAAGADLASVQPVMTRKEAVPNALITGVYGQDGYYLLKLLASKGYKVFGFVRDSHDPRGVALKQEFPGLKLVEGDLRSLPSLVRAIEVAQPDEVYNLAGVSFVPLSFAEPELAADINGMGALRVLEAIRRVSAAARFYQASSSEIFGRAEKWPQNEETPFRPHSPYGAAKGYGHSITVSYRESLGIFACNGILYNHESPRRPTQFVTRKVSNAVARIKLGLETELPLGELSARRDWGYAGDYVEAMWLMLQQEEPDDYIIASGELHTVGQLVEVAFSHADLDWERYVVSDPQLIRAGDVRDLVGNPAKAATVLGWEPTVSFERMIQMMVEHDLELGARR